MSVKTTVVKLCAEIRALSEQQQKNPQLLKSEAIDLELRVDACVRDILRSDMKPQEKEDAQNELSRARALLMQNHAGKGFAQVHLNVAQNIISTPKCPALNQLRIPTVSTYQSIAPQICTIRLDASALAHVPANILEKLGDLSGKHVELNYTVINGTYLAKDRPLNLSAHAWAYPTLLPGADVHTDVNMGLFEGLGYTKEREWDGRLEFDGLSPMNTHVHFRGEGTPGRVFTSGDMLYSPDNAHFRRLTDSPFGAHWAVTTLGDRVGITKTVVLFNLYHPISAAFRATVDKTPTLHNFILELENVNEAIDDTFARIIDRSERGLSIETTFFRLPDMFQEGIFLEAWKLKGRPQLPNFGEKSFKQNETLDLAQRCTTAEQTQAIYNYVNSLKQQLVHSTIQLLLEQPLLKSDTAAKMMRCAALFFQNNPKDAYQLFNTFSGKEKESVYGASWNLIGCTISDNVGKKAFEDPSAPVAMKAEALLLAASQQSHAAALTPTLPFVSILDLQPLALPTSPSILDLQPIVLQPRAVASQVVSPSSSSIVEILLERVSTSEFQALNNKKRAEEVSATLTTLSEEVRNRIYRKVYELAPDPKGGDRWGELHIGDNVDVLISALLDLNI